MTIIPDILNIMTTMMMMMILKNQIRTNCFQNICMTFLGKKILRRNYYYYCYYYWWQYYHNRQHQWSNFTLTNSMEQSPWEADICSSSPEISRFSWDPKVHKRAQSVPPVNSFVWQMNPVHIITPYFLMSIPRPSCPHRVYSRNSVYKSVQIMKHLNV
jgi:hypothetical protein